MICPNDRSQMVNYTIEKQVFSDENSTSSSYKIEKITPLPNGGIAQDDVYETWYVYECPICGRRVKEAYRCEVLLDKWKF